MQDALNVRVVGAEESQELGINKSIANVSFESAYDSRIEMKVNFEDMKSLTQQIS